jgi:hypothetical protein
VEVAEDAAARGSVLIAQDVAVVEGEFAALTLAVGLDHDRELDGTRRPETALAVAGEELAAGPVDRAADHAPRALAVPCQRLDALPVGGDEGSRPGARGGLAHGDERRAGGDRPQHAPPRRRFGRLPEQALTMVRHHRASSRWTPRRQPAAA